MMPLYRYRVIDADGRLQRGTLTAPDPESLALRLSRRGAVLIGVRTVRLAGWRHRVSRAERIQFCLQLEQLLSAGVTLLDALSELHGAAASPSLRWVSGGVLDAIEGGQTLSDALAAYPGAFDAVFVSLVRSGEASGQLPEVFRRLADGLKWQDELLAAAKRAALYPAILLGIVLAVSVFLLLYIVPQLVDFLSAYDQAPPWYTRLLIEASGFLVRWTGPMLLLCAFVAVALVGVVRASPSARYRWDAFTLWLWPVGAIRYQLLVARFAGLFGLLYASGIHVLEALRIAEDTLGNRLIGEAVRDARHRIAAGQGLAEGFAETRRFPSLFVRMLRVGERTGGIDTAMQSVSYFLSRTVRERVERMQVLLEPALLLFLGMLYALIIVSVFSPVYDLLRVLR